MPSAEKKDRKRRSKGEQTREMILDGALRVLARDGLRGVTHRAVAAEAGVQLSLTTYYFKDIDALIEQAFELFCERARPTNENIWTTLFDYMDRYSPAELRKNAVRERICADLADMATDIILQGVAEKPEGLAVEQVFLSSVPQAENLREMATQHRQSLLNPLVRLCSLVNKRDPEIDAALLLDTMTRLEYEALLLAPEEIDRDYIARLLRRQIGWALGLKRA
ncbi:MAG: TetR family transcriptional regulator [Halieaceae bacterium]|jgi:DNA-binding transcriptional regulator YbjK|nr:TetR family transcriptional regulator [Halieaceae bacterium]